MIYMDYNATTPIDPGVLEAMTPFLQVEFGNPSTQYASGRRANEAVDEARSQVAALLNCSPEEIVFTSGGSESNNTVIKGIAAAYKGKARHIITSQVEHPSVLEPCRYLEAEGVEVTYLEVDRHGRVHPRALQEAIRPETILVSIMHANNEVGTLQPIAELSAIAREAGVLFHTDAAQSVGKISTRVDELGVDFMTIAAHKLYGPKGIGALYVREGIRYVPLIHGAGQERGRRAGTENVAYIVGLGKACQLAGQVMEDERCRIQALRDHLFEGLKAAVPNLVLNGHPTERLPNTLNVAFPGVWGEQVLAQCPEICASTGSACHEDSREISPVLRAMGLPDKEAMGAVRLSLGRYTTEEEVDQVVEVISRWAKSQKTGTGLLNRLKRWLSLDR